LPTALVTGAHGFLGRHFAARLAREGWRVVGLGHGDWSPAQALDWGVCEWIPGDINAATLRRALSLGMPALVFHAGGGGSVQAAQHDPAADLRRSVLALGDVLDALREFTPESRLIFPSSAAVYGACPDESLHEDRPLAPVSLYGVHKAMSETLIRGHVAAYGLRAAIVRYFSVYGRGLRKQLLWDVCCRLEQARSEPIELFGDGNETRDMLHVEDAVDIGLRAAKALESDSLLVINGGTGTASTVREIAGRLAALYGAPEPRFNRRIREGDPRHYRAGMGRCAALGFSPRWRLSAGLEDFVSWKRSCA